MKQKEIWLVCLDPTVGAEIRKTRPCVILNDDAIGVLPLKVIAPITDHKDKYDDVPWMIRICSQEQNNLEKGLGSNLVHLYEHRFIFIRF